MMGRGMLLLAALATVGMFAASGRAADAGRLEATVSISSITIPIGDEGFVELRVSGLAPPGLGAWQIDITYDSSVVALLACTPFEEAVCSTAFGPETGRLSGASRQGIVEDVVLARWHFRCGPTPGTAELTMSINVLADATPGDPQDIDEGVENGMIVCAPRQAAPTETVPAVTATPAVALPSTGTGARDSRPSAVGLLATGLAAAAAATAGWALVRRRRS